MKKLFLLLSIAILAGCNPARITSSWEQSNVSPKRYDKVLVLALIGEPDRTIREKMEEHLAGDLQQLGYNAVTSMQEYGPKAFEGMKEADAINMLSEKGIDAVVTIVLLDKQKERYYVPSHIRRSPYVIYHDHFWRYYSTMYDRVYTPGYYTTDTKYFWESNLFDLNDWKLLYSAQSQSFDPESTDNLAHRYGQMIVKDMVKKHVIAQQPKTLKSF